MRGRERRKRARHDGQGQAALPDQRGGGDAQAPPPDAPNVREEGPRSPEPNGRTDAHLLARRRGGYRPGDALGARPRRESGRDRDHLKDETPDARHAGADRGLDGVRASRHEPVPRCGEAWQERGAGAGRLEPAGAGGPLLNVPIRPERIRHIMADEKIPEREPNVVIPDQVALLPLRDTVLFPQSILPLAAGRASSLNLIEDA